MSYSGNADGAYYNSDTITTVGSGQALLMAGWINPTSLTNEIGLCSLSTTNDGRTPNNFSLQIDPGGELKFREGSPNLNNIFSTLTVSTGSWQRIGVFLSNGFDATSQTLKGYLDGSSESTAYTPINFSGANFIAMSAGDGSFARTDHKGAYLGVWGGITEAQADSIISSMASTAPGSISPSPTLDFDFLTAVPSGFTANGSISIDAGDNPTLSPPAATFTPIIITA